MIRDRLEQIREVAGAVSRETLQRLEAFEAEFLKWSARINLAAPSTLDALWSRHILDSAQLAGLKPMHRHGSILARGAAFPAP